MDDEGQRRNFNRFNYFNYFNAWAYAHSPPGGKSYHALLNTGLFSSLQPQRGDGVQPRAPRGTSKPWVTLHAQALAAPRILNCLRGASSDRLGVDAIATLGPLLFGWILDDLCAGIGCVVLWLWRGRPYDLPDEWRRLRTLRASAP
ncbi:hypothetical protein [Prosthecobacter sp.]|uniref:hypothetical protein n=1 Tax=Prosthecobacter sp. TaxID=1965333 RepID=UPI0037839B6A